MIRASKRLLSSTALTMMGLLIMVPLGASAADPVQPWASVGAKPGTDRSIVTTEFWAPLMQSDDNVFYGDFRMMGDDSDNQEGNLGLGYRQIVTETDSVLGGHIWIDRRNTENNSTFHQLTFGLESLGKSLDLRANGYVPLDGSNTIITPNIGSATPYLAGSGIYYDTNGSVVETPQYGFDAEVGYRLPYMQKEVDALRVYGGVYDFWREDTDRVAGVRVRTEAQINEAVTLGARFQYDDERGSQAFLEATLRFPFKTKKMYQKDGLRSRLDEAPERDVDIVTDAKVDNGLMKPFLNPISQQAQRILYVDNTAAAGGDGTKEHPLNSLQAAQANLKANDIVYVYHGDGTSTNMNQGITINQSGVSLIGSGSALTYAGYTFINAGAAPIITNVNASGGNEMLGNGVLGLADNLTVTGLSIQNITGGGYGILVSGDSALWNKVNIYNNTVSNTGTVAILVKDSLGGNISNVIIANNITNNSGITASTGKNILALNNTLNDGGLGFSVSGMETLLIDGNTTNNHAGAGLYINTTGQNGDITISNQTSLYDNQGIVILQNNTSDQLNSLNINGANIVNNAFSNIDINNSGSIGRVSLSNVTANNAGIGNGVSVGNSGNIDNLNLSDVTANNNTRIGLNITNSGTGSISQISGTNINVSNNGTDGLDLSGNATSIINSAIFSGLTINNNAAAGIALTASNGAAINSVSLSNSDVSGNSFIGLLLTRDSSAIENIDFGGGALGSTGNNRVYNNTAGDAFLLLNGGSVTAQNNWWGISTGLSSGRYFTDGTSTLDASNYLTIDPRP